MEEDYYARHLIPGVIFSGKALSHKIENVRVDEDGQVIVEHTYTVRKTKVTKTIEESWGRGRVNGGRFSKGLLAGLKAQGCKVSERSQPRPADLDPRVPTVLGVDIRPEFVKEHEAKVRKNVDEFFA